MENHRSQEEHDDNSDGIDHRHRAVCEFVVLFGWVNIQIEEAVVIIYLVIRFVQRS